MTTKFFTDRELRKAAAMVRSSMLESLPENPDGEFSEEFLIRLDDLREVKKRDEKYQKYRKRLSTAVAAFFIAMTLLLSLSTEVRAAVATWFKEVFSSYTTYWFVGEDQDDLPAFKLTEVPEGFICIHDKTLNNSRSMIYQSEHNPSDIFSVRYALLQPEAPLTVSYPDTNFYVSEVMVDGLPAEMYISRSSEESHALVWIDEHNGVVFTITTLGDPNSMLHIASLLELVK